MDCENKAKNEDACREGVQSITTDSSYGRGCYRNFGEKDYPTYQYGAANLLSPGETWRPHSLSRNSG